MREIPMSPSTFVLPFLLTTDNKLTGNLNAGIAFFESMDGQIYNNTISGCDKCKFGIRLSLGSENNVIENNTLDNFSRYGLYTYKGSDKPEASDGRPKNNKFINNYVSNVKVGVQVKDSRNIVFDGEFGVGVLWLRDLCRLPLAQADVYVVLVSAFAHLTRHLGKLSPRTPHKSGCPVRKQVLKRRNLRVGETLATHATYIFPHVAMFPHGQATSSKTSRRTSSRNQLASSGRATTR